MRAFLILIAAQLINLGSSESVKLGVRVDQSVPRHRCRRALRNLEEVIVAASKQLYELSEYCNSLTAAGIESSLLSTQIFMGTNSNFKCETEEDVWKIFEGSGIPIKTSSNKKRFASWIRRSNERWTEHAGIA